MPPLMVASSGTTVQCVGGAALMPVHVATVVLGYMSSGILVHDGDGTLVTAPVPVRRRSAHACQRGPPPCVGAILIITRTHHAATSATFASPEPSPRCR